LTVFVDDVTSLVAFQPRHFQKLILRAIRKTIRIIWIHRDPMFVSNTNMFSTITPNLVNLQDRHNSRNQKSCLNPGYRSEGGRTGSDIDSVASSVERERR
jgi:hypothetical protein